MTRLVKINDAEEFMTNLLEFFEQKKAVVTAITDKTLTDEVIELIVACMVRSEQSKCKKYLQLMQHAANSWQDVA